MPRLVAEVPFDPEALVAQIFEDLLTTLRTDLVQRNTTAPSFVIVVAADGSPARFAMVFDPATHIQTIRSAVGSVPNAVGFVYVYDGHIVEQAGPREALLLMRGTRAGVYARAFPYQRTPFGARFDDSQVYEPPPTLLTRYKGMFP